MAVQEKWQWQEPGTAWKGVGIYHITLTVPSRQPLLGTLAISEGDPTKARVVRTALGNALVDCLMSIPRYHPEVQVLHFCLMPDHLHAVLYVRRIMEKGIGALVRGFWQASKKLGRAFSVASSIPPNNIRENNQEESRNPYIRENSQEERGNPYIRGNNQEERENPYIRGTLQEETRGLEDFSATLQKQMGDKAYYQQEPIFTEMPFIRPMGRRSQLPNTIRYIDMNPQRLATKRLKPGFFRVQRGIEIGGRSYAGVGNTTLLIAERFETVHVRRAMVQKAEQGDDAPLRDYMNSCVLAARKGAVMVSPFISPQEKQVMEVLLRESLSFILLTDNGFREYYKPTDALFNACAAGRVLILSPWEYDAGKRHISREDCVALNTMAEEITKI